MIWNTTRPLAADKGAEGEIYIGCEQNICGI